MDLLDLVLLVLLVIAAVNGYQRGAVLQLTAYAGLLVGLLVGALVAPRLARLASSPLSQASIALIALVALAGLGDALGWVIGMRFWAVTHRTVLRSADAVAGSLVAVVAVLLTVWFVGLNLTNGPIPSVSREVRGSAIVQGLDQVLPHPPSLLAEVRQFFNRFGFPEVFAGLPPAPAGPVQGPSDAQARAIAAKADKSTVRIVGSACGEVLEGSGFVVAPNYVVTNAHVVAGVHGPEVQEQNGPSQAATTVLFDPRLDIAILWVKVTPGPVLALAPKDEDRGTDGAVLGYPGGGPLTFGPAAVRRELAAVGRDIYGQSIVERSVYELQAVVRPGNSGGPFVLSDGKVAGVVFAASTTNPDLGYAIASTEVTSKVKEADGKRQAVSTQGCAR